MREKMTLDHAPFDGTPVERQYDTIQSHDRRGRGDTQCFCDAPGAKVAQLNVEGPDR
jgi:hypothetical protein